MGITSNVIGYEHIQVVSPYELVQLTDLEIVRKPNEHGRVNLSGIIPEEKKDCFIGEATSKDRIEINLINSEEGPRNLFRGRVSFIKVNVVRGIYYLELEALSYTCDLEIKLKSRSFQNLEMRYLDLFREVLDEYEGGDCNDQATNDAKLEKLIIQYMEDDWSFLKRVASHFGTVLIPDTTQPSPKFWLGVPEINEYNLEDLNYLIKKDLSGYRIATENIFDQMETDFVRFEVECDYLFNIGDQVRFQGVRLVVAEIRLVLERGLLKQHYALSLKSGIRQNPIYNEQLTGVTLPGKVIDRLKDQVRIHLNFDPEQSKEDAYWFPYASFYTAEGNSGWHWMPELGDKAHLYFPNYHEGNALVLNSVRQDDTGNPLIGDHNIKYLGNTYGKLLMMDEKKLKFTAKEEKGRKMFVDLDCEEGITITSDQEIQITSKNNINWDAKWISINAGQGLYMRSKSGSMIIDGQVNIKSPLVRYEAIDKRPEASRVPQSSVSLEKSRSNSTNTMDENKLGQEGAGCIPGVVRPSSDATMIAMQDAKTRALASIPCQI